jgi:diguanylate cyclase (GGDEF)-like protein
MKRISTTLLITLSLVSIVISAVFVAYVSGVFPNSNHEIAEARIALCESIALHCSHAVARHDTEMIEESLEMLVRRNDGILAARMRKQSGEILSQAGDERFVNGGVADIAMIPIADKTGPWGEVQIAFVRRAPDTLSALLTAPVTRFAVVLGAFCGLVFQFYLRPILHHLDSTRVPPDRVRATRDTLAEGLDHQVKECQGALVRFEDVTALEARTVELTNMLEKLRASREKIRKQNQQLIALATRDPLTGAFNRRSLFEKIGHQWEATKRNGAMLSCIMVDIDYFKGINDGHGHAMGDQVLKQAVAMFHGLARPDDIVGRLGGEEFCLLLPSTDLDSGVEFAEKIRVAFEQFDFSGLSVTASFGVAQMTTETESPEELIECADQSLYVAKRTGRNRVVSFLDVEELEPKDAGVGDDSSDLSVVSSESAIPFQTVAALTAALAYRDVATAQHSRRVADYCFKLGSELMSISECYVLENAALLHDIGKMGVPGHILLKPGALTDDEREVMRTHERIGVEIIRSTFACWELTRVVENRQARFSGSPDEPRLPSGKEIPLGARILAIADSYDAMVSDRVYRKGLTQDAAFAELRRCARTQFDPELVEMFVRMILQQEAMVESSLVVGTVDKQTALRLGIQIEDLAQALDDQDRQRLTSIATAISETAARYDVPEVAMLAEELRASAGNDDQWIENLGLTIELMELCRLTQLTHLRVDTQSGDPAKSAGDGMDGQSPDHAATTADS